MYKKAFSLVELSIVILIIGVLIAAIGQGSELYQESRIKAARMITQSSRVASIKGLSLWLETSMEDSFPSTYEDGDSVVKWTSINPQNVKKKSFVPMSTAPLYSESSINGLAAISFSGNGMQSEVASVFGDFVASDQVSLFVVWNNHSISDAFLFNTGSFPKFGIHAPWATTGQAFFDFGFDRSIVPAPVGMTASTINTPVILSYVKRPTTAEARVNGRAPYINATIGGTLDLSSATTPMIISGGIPGDGYTADVAEMIIFSRGLSAKERVSVEKYLSKKYAIKLG